MIKNPTINDFKISENSECSYISWNDIKSILGAIKYKKFLKWMSNQTCIEDGAFVCDVENYLRPNNKRVWD